MTDRFGNITISSEKKEKDTNRPVTQRKTKKYSSRKKSKRKTSNKNKTFVSLLIVICLLAGLYCFVGYYLFPHYLQQKLTNALQEKYSLQTNINSITFNPFTFKIIIKDLKLLEPVGNDQNSSIVHLPQINAKLAPFELIRNEYVVKVLNIYQPQFFITRYKENTYNFTEYIKGKTSQPSEDFLDFAKLPFFYSLNNITLEDGQIAFDDKPSGQVHSIKDISLGIPNLSNFDYKTDIFVSSHFSAEVDGIPLKVTKEKDNNGSSSVSTFSIDLADIDLPAYTQYLPFSLPLEVDEGKLNGKLKLSFNEISEKAKQLSINFQLEINDIATRTHDHSLIISADSCKLLGTYSPLAKDMFLDNVYVSKPYFKVANDFSKTTLDSFLFDDNKNSSNRSRLSINRFFFNEGKLEFADNKGNKTQTWSDLQLTIKDYQTTSGLKVSKPGELKLSASLKKNGAALIWNGKIINNSSIEGDISVQNFPPEYFSSLFLPDDLKLEGSTGSLKGKFTLSPAQKDHAKNEMNYLLTDTIVEIQKPSVHHFSQSIIQAESMKFINFTFGRYLHSYGDLTLTNASLNLSTKDLPHIFSPLLGKNSSLLDSVTANGKLILNNSKNQKQYTFKSISLETAKDKKKKELQHITFEGVTENEGEIIAKGTGQFTPLQMSLSIEFQHIHLPNILPLFTTNPIVSNYSATLSGKGKYSYPQSGYFGSLVINDTSIVMDNATKFQATQINIPQLNFKSAPFSLRAGEIKCSAPIIYWNQNADTPQKSFATFLTEIFPIKDFPEKTEKFKYPFYDFEKIEVENGTLYSLSKDSQKTKYHLKQIALRNLRFPSRGKETTFTVKASQNDTVFNLKGSGDFFTSSPNGKATLSFSNFNGKNIGSKALEAGLFVEQSKVSGTIASEWFNEESKNQVSLKINNVLPLDPTSISAVTLALLYTSSPEFTMELEHQKRPELPYISLTETVINNFKKDLIKVQISPFLLTPDFSDLTGRNTLVFSQGSTELNGEAQETLIRISELLKLHPLLVLTLESNLSNDDIAQLQNVLEENELKRVTLENNRRYKQWQIKNEQASQKREEVEREIFSNEVVEENIEIPEIEPFHPLKPAPVKVTKEQISQLRTTRLNVVKNFLRNELGITDNQIKELRSTENKDLSGIELSFTTGFKASE